MEVKPISIKAINSINKTGYLNVWEGAVRSGKTVASSISWILYVSQSREKYFIMSGKTIATLYRNVIGGEFGILAMLGKRSDYRIDREGNRVLRIYADGNEKLCYCFGANDERSFNTLRGFTAGGWYADEVNLQPRSFVEEALRRTIVSSDRKHFWTLNPDNPMHWIYTEYIDVYEDKELEGFYLWKFTLDDNKAIPESTKEQLKQQYSGVFYRRYILGERCVAAGIIYDSFSDENIYTEKERPKFLEDHTMRTISCDYGTTNPCHWLDIYDDGKISWIDNEYVWDSRDEKQTALRGRAQKTDSEYVDDLVEFIGERHCLVLVDPSAASFKAEMHNRGISTGDAKNEVLDGIRKVSKLFKLNKIKINSEKCPKLIKELKGYHWDEDAAKKGIERPIKVADHGADALRYYVYTKVPSWRTEVK